MLQQGDTAAGAGGDLGSVREVVRSSDHPGWAVMVTERRNTMQAFSIRQLKSNPSAVLRAAEADVMALVTSHQQPAALVVALDRLGLPNTEAVRSGLALSLFRSGSIFVASAAQVAGLPLPRFWRSFSR
jgi:antitoxin (DNA-binding transcriptional repressor) of toxin-antitoxin stability system